jgi:hypothetical protein
MDLDGLQVKVFIDVRGIEQARTQVQDEFTENSAHYQDD